MSQHASPQLSCPRGPVLAVMFWLFCPGCLVLALMSLLSSFGRSVLSFLTSSGWPGWPVPAVIFLLPTPAVLLWLSCHSCLVSVLLFRLSCPSCSVLKVIFWASSPLYRILADCPWWPVRQTYPNGPVTAVLPKLSSPGCHIPGYPLMAVLPWLSFSLSCPSCFVPSFSGYPADMCRLIRQANLSRTCSRCPVWMSCPGCVVMVVLPRLPGLGCPAPAVLSCHVLAVLSSPLSATVVLSICLVPDVLYAEFRLSVIKNNGIFGLPVVIDKGDTICWSVQIWTLRENSKKIWKRF
jgi:hypothetical protein